MEIQSNVYKQIIKSEIDYIFLNSILKNELWEKHIVSKISDLLEDETDFIDVGANIGLITLGVNLNINNKKINIHCFECDSNNFTNLKFNTKNHNNIKIYNFGLGDNFSLGNMSINRYNNGCSYIKNCYSKDESKELNYNCFKESDLENNTIQHDNYFAIVKLDDIRYMFKNRVSVIKIDVEGYEKQVLVGAKKFIEEHKPYIFIEIFIELHEEIFYFILNELNYELVENIKIDNEISIDYLFKPK